MAMKQVCSHKILGFFCASRILFISSADLRLPSHSSIHCSGRCSSSSQQRVPLALDIRYLVIYGILSIGGSRSREKCKKPVRFDSTNDLRIQHHRAERFSGAKISRLGSSFSGDPSTAVVLSSGDIFLCSFSQNIP